ncbi:hypothetical protein CAI21_03465 [Alkalilimnicola ehrlichii]|uniref:HDOD domain-containing protein n=1 Tax=Alkalilimnicola ehrlichii TaxID=351052 RepID=A0A3E0X0N8_9GAMM|nr:HDOD domain-containing protein [Alkalilimnicola ehrlichii]RFA31041.1 hypothetical protein CAI21_03465 [Alkalilimnicola ehrlichii]RFA38994.1 hypothetical protein CAL65_03615 [Alkalilimnicola ehrlichii]
MARPRRLQDWVDALSDYRLPMLPFSEQVLTRLAEENASPRVAELCAIVYRDPALVQHIVRTANSLQHKHLSTRVNSLEQAVMMLGLDRVLQLPQEMPRLEDSLAEPYRSGYLEALGGVYHAAVQAWNWARERHDMVPSEVFTATLLRQIGELALWAYDGDVMLELKEIQAHHDGYRDASEYVHLGFPISELSLALVQHWRLPTLVIENLRPERALGPRPYSILLALRLDSIAHKGWHTQEMEIVVKALARFLKKDIAEVPALIHQAALQAERETHFLSSHPYAPLLTEPDTEPEQAPPPKPNRAYFCPARQPELLSRALHELEKGDYSRIRKELAAKHEYLAEEDPVISLGLRALHSGLGLDRVVFAKYSHNRNALEPYMQRGAEDDPAFHRFRLTLGADTLAGALMSEAKALWVHDKNKDKYLSIIPRDVHKALGVDTFFTASIYVDGKPFGLFYADRHLPGCELDTKTFNEFRAICALVMRQLKRL